ncbi:RhtB (resistance to homoserine/threonine) family protein [Paucibacter oligotrophus]|uniref:RhtB (Resistance to homoserine/threonine) family protein n=1 Tax=Roseateles oligotrophus TaxID=1769250 RepID=A0A840L3H6_9BURK|nr:LysE family translocator [Roseateles oligotrophus]MBB4842506.1 RhtB (resistance to homoserine/threonine) family protein [Roseateles oligotrophus]
MFGTQDLTLFIISGLLLNIAPGPDSLLIMSRSASQGWRAGVSAALGIGAGTCVHVLAAALGLSALLATSAWAFTVIKWVGAAYLVYIGLQMLLSRRVSTAAEPLAAPPALSYRKIFAQGFLTNVLNPKVALFFLAFVPQFIAPDAAHKSLAFIVLGAIFNFNGMLWCNFLAIFTALASRRLRLQPWLRAWLNRAIGALFLSFGLKLALASK